MARQSFEVELNLGERLSGTEIHEILLQAGFPIQGTTDRRVLEIDVEGPLTDELQEDIGNAVVAIQNLARRINRLFRRVYPEKEFTAKSMKRLVQRARESRKEEA